MRAWLISLRLKLHGLQIALAMLFTVIRPTPPDPIQDEWNHEKQSLLLKNDMTLKYLEMGPDAGDPIIFLHGITASSRAWSLVAPYLNEQYKLYCLDLRGHGDSTKPRYGYSVQKLAEDVLDFMDQKNIHKAHFIGHSMGGFVSQYFAIHWPDRVQTIGLIGTALKIKRNRVVQPLEIVTQPVPLISKLIVEESKAPHPLNPAFLKHLVREAFKIPIRVWRQGIHGVFKEDFSLSLKNIQIPALIIWGQRDPLFRNASQTLLRAALPHATVKIYARAGHNPHYEFPAKIAEDIRTFLEHTLEG
jgi:pimeloyl-ACP methyl ester carboxylesterase